MGQYHVEVSRIIKAPADKVYALLRDYHEGHPAILPSRYFSDLAVTEGGVGQGTAIRVTLNVFGSKFLYHLTVSEPEPGRVLIEKDESAGVITTFIVDPVPNGAQSHVTIATTARTGNGFRGWLERLVTPRITKKIYTEELTRLANVASQEH